MTIRIPNTKFITDNTSVSPAAVANYGGEKMTVRPSEETGESRAKLINDEMDKLIAMVQESDDLLKRIDMQAQKSQGLARS